MLCSKNAVENRVAVLIEHRISNSRLTNCARFRCVAQHCESSVSLTKWLCSALHRIAHFCSKIFSDRRSDREKISFACAWSCPRLAPATQWQRFKHSLYALAHCSAFILASGAAELGSICCKHAWYLASQRSMQFAA